jgi:hypothetical protein
MKRLILTLTTLAGLAIGASAATQMITSLPKVIDQPGDYLLDPSAVTQPVYSAANGAIQITTSNVNLDLNGLTIECVGQGLCVGNSPGNSNLQVNHVSVKNGTVDGAMQPPSPTTGYYFGLVIGVGSDHVSVAEVSFTGNFAASYDYGSYTSLKNCTFQAYLQIYPYPPFAIGINPGHSDYKNLTVSAASGSPALLSFDSMYTAPFNDFKNITVLSGDVQLSAGDTYQHFFLGSSATFTGGINVQPGNQAKNSK